MSSINRVFIVEQNCGSWSASNKMENVNFTWKHTSCITALLHVTDGMDTVSLLHPLGRNSPACIWINTAYRVAIQLPDSWNCNALMDLSRQTVLNMTNRGSQGCCAHSQSYSYCCTYKAIIRGNSWVLLCALKGRLTDTPRMKIIQLNWNNNVKHHRIFESAQAHAMFAWQCEWASMCVWRERERGRERAVLLSCTERPALFWKKSEKAQPCFAEATASLSLVERTSPNRSPCLPAATPKQTGNTSDCLRDLQWSNKMN